MVSSESSDTDALDWRLVDVSFSQTHARVMSVHRSTLNAFLHSAMVTTPLPSNVLFQSLLLRSTLAARAVAAAKAARFKRSVHAAGIARTLLTTSASRDVLPPSPLAPAPPPPLSYQTPLQLKGLSGTGTDAALTQTFGRSGPSSTTRSTPEATPAR